MPYDMLNNRGIYDALNYVNTPTVQQQPVERQPIQQEQPQQMSEYQQMMSRLPNAKYLGDDYRMDKWLADDEASGVTNPLIRMMRYNAFAKPLVDQAREDEIRESFSLASNPNTDPHIKTEALAKLAYYMKNPDLVNETNLKRMKTLQGMGLMENPNYNTNYNVGNNILSSLGDFTEGEQWMSPDGTGDSRTQCSNFVSDVLRRSGIKGLYSANGDELMRQFGSAYHNGLDGIKPGDVLNFKDHVGFYVGNGQYVARNSSGGVHQGTMDEAVAAFGQPLGYGSVSEFTGANRKYIKDPNYVSPREEYNRRIYEADRNYNRLVNQDNLRYANGGRSRGVTQQAFDKANASMRNSALNLAQLQNINSEDEKEKKQFETSMNKFANDIGSLCQVYDDGTKDPLTFGLLMYNELNKTPSGLRPEVLAEGIARAVYARRGDVDPFKLQEEMLKYIYNGGRQQQSGSDSVADFRRYDNEHPFSYKVLDMAENRRNGWDNAFR